jgi:hypothetical protein
VTQPPPPSYRAPQPGPAAVPRLTRKGHTVLWVLLAVITVAAAVAVAAIAGTSGSKNPATVSTVAPSPTMSHRLNLQEVSRDVLLGRLIVDPVLGSPTVLVTVTNHSSQRSTYSISLTVTSANGRTQLGSAVVFASLVGPGVSVAQRVQFNTRGRLPPGAKVVIQSVDQVPVS